MECIDTALPAVSIARTERFADARGSFARWFCSEELATILGSRQVLQINHSVTERKGSLRGMHFQLPPAAEMKLVRCLRGRVFDVAVDLRTGSETFLSWYGEELTAEDEKLMIIPEGFAHGLQALEDGCELLYLHTAAYFPELDGGLRFDDPAIGINWPVPITVISERDTSHALIGEDFRGIVV